MNPRLIAQACHEMNRIWCESVGDLSQPTWSYLEEEFKLSAEAGVNAVLDNPDISASELHERWMDRKVRDGWGYGPKKDAVKKTHPCMVPYGELPAHDRAKDLIFRNTVLTFMRAGLV